MRHAALLIAALILCADEAYASVVCAYKYWCAVDAATGVTTCDHKEDHAPGATPVPGQSYEYCYTGFRSICDEDASVFLSTWSEFKDSIEGSGCLALNEVSARVTEPPWGPWSPATCAAPATRTRNCNEPSGALPSSEALYCHEGTTDGPHPCPP